MYNLYIVKHDYFYKQCLLIDTKHIFLQKWKSHHHVVQLWIIHPCWCFLPLQVTLFSGKCQFVRSLPQFQSPVSLKLIIVKTCTIGHIHQLNQLKVLHTCYSRTSVFWPQKVTITGLGSNPTGERYFSFQFIFQNNLSHPPLIPINKQYILISIIT